MNSIVMIITCFLTLTQSRPQPQSNFMMWNYFPFLQQQQLQMMQQANIPILHPVNIPHPMQYPTFEMFFNPPLPMARNMPMIAEVQFQVPVPQTPPPSALPRTTQRPRPTATTTTTTTTTTPLPPQPPPTSTTRPTKRRASVKQSTPAVAESLKSQLSKGIFEMARNIQANILSADTNQQAGKFNLFSPINVAAVLSLLELGANGQTNQELQHILGFDKLNPSERRTLDRHYALGQMFESVLRPETAADATAAEVAQINMANGIFMQTGYNMRQDYRTSVETIYQSQVSALDFQQQPAMATEFINDWVRQETNGKIGNILADGIDKSTRMMVASAVHFKALWESSFILAATTKRPFYPNGREGQKIMVDTMGNGGVFKHYESKDYDCEIMALPFKGQTTVMYVVLPKKSNGERLRKLQATLTADIIEEMISKMQMRTSIITLPKMHLSSTLDLKDILGQLKVRSVFDDGRSDLSGIVEHNQLSLDGFVHKVDLSIDETGTEAAAATVTNLSRKEFEVEFRVDSPFMFFVRHEETKLPIFYGSVIEPVA